MDKWIGETIIVPGLIGAVCGTFFDPVSLAIAASLALTAIWIFGFNYFLKENVKKEKKS